LAGSFIISGQTKTVAEMSEQEYKMFGTTNRWKELAKYLSQKESNNKP